MSFSIDGISSMVDMTKNATAANGASSLQKAASSISSETTEEELMEVCKDFTSYFVEEV